MKKIGLKYLLAALFCIVFAAIYEYFSHQVYSDYMIFAFAIPMLGGALPFLLMTAYGSFFPGRTSISLYHSGIMALTVGSIMHGVLDIYGTTNSLINIYWAAGALLIAAGILVAIMRSRTVKTDS